jgi:hypothetical protein
LARGFRVESTFSRGRTDYQIQVLSYDEAASYVLSLFDKCEIRVCLDSFIIKRGEDDRRTYESES